MLIIRINLIAHEHESSSSSPVWTQQASRSSFGRFFLFAYSGSRDEGGGDAEKEADRVINERNSGENVISNFDWLGESPQSPPLLLLVTQLPVMMMANRMVGGGRRKRSTGGSHKPVRYGFQ